MQSISVLFRTFAVLAALPALFASDFTGVYARIDRVVIEDGTAQIYGVFAVASPDNRNDYLAPVRGYLYFKTGANAEMTRNEWNDLKSVAGTGEIVAFGSRPFTARMAASVKVSHPFPLCELGWPSRTVSTAFSNRTPCFAHGTR